MPALVANWQSIHWRQFRLAGGLNISPFVWHSQDPGALQQLSVTVALGPGVHHTGLGWQSADPDLGSGQVHRDAHVPSGGGGGGSHEGHVVFPHFGTVVAAVDAGDVHTGLDQFGDQSGLLGGEGRQCDHDRRGPCTDSLSKLPPEQSLAMGLEEGLATKTGGCRRRTLGFHWQALELLEHPDHSRKACIQMAITAT